jgi:allophanate hydrolase subunit 2
VMLALTGAPAPATVDGTEVAYFTPFVLRDGHTLRLAIPLVGLRTYLSVRGGVDVPAVWAHGPPTCCPDSDPRR